MRASARIVAEADRFGGTRLPVLRGESPLLFRRTGPDVLHLVGGAAGPLRGDELRLEIEVGAYARLEIRSVAATLLLPGRPGPPSRLLVHARVGDGAVLRWLPEPVIAAAGCDHRAVTTVEVADGGALVWRDELVCGRHGEPPGVVRAETTVRYAGRTLHRHDLTVGADGWDGAAVLGGHRAVGTVLVAGPRLPEPAPRGWKTPSPATPSPATPSPDAAVLALAGPGVLVTAAGPDIRAVRAALDPFCEPAADDADRQPAALAGPRR